MLDVIGHHAADYDHSHSARKVLLEILTEPGVIAKHGFRLVGADGQEVTFPLKLVFDTRLSPLR